MVCSIERAFSHSFEQAKDENNGMTSLLRKEEIHLSFDMIEKQVAAKHDFRFDNLYIYC